MSQFANKNKNSSFYALLQLPGISINSVEIQQEAIIVNGKIKKKDGICPHCRKKSNTIHGFYYRTLQDLSILSKPVTIKLKIKKFKCKNEKCK